MTKKQLKAMLGNHGIAATENREVIQELREIKNDIKEVKKFLIINSLRQLVANYDQQAKKKNKKISQRLRISRKRQDQKARNCRMG
jgi:hypothetical protein